MIKKVKLQRIRSREKSGALLATSAAVLPLHIKRPFELWAYEVSHRRLLLRTQFTQGEEVIEIEFLNVLGMKVKDYYKELFIGSAEDGSEIEEFIDIPDDLRDHFKKLVVSDGDVGGFVVCGKVRVRNG